jgi:hypothetical protein
VRSVVGGPCAAWCDLGNLQMQSSTSHQPFQLGELPSTRRGGRAFEGKVTGTAVTLGDSPVKSDLHGDYSVPQAR